MEESNYCLMFAWPIKDIKCCVLANDDGSSQRRSIKEQFKENGKWMDQVKKRE